MKKIDIVLSLLCGMLLVLTGCSDTAKAVLGDAGYAKEVIQEKIDETTEKDEEVAVSGKDAEDELVEPGFAIKQIGEAFVVSEYDNSSKNENDWLECVVSDAVIYDSPLDAGITQDDMIGADYYAGGDELEWVEPQQATEMKMLVCTLNLKLLEGSKTVNITEFELVYRAPDGSLQMVAYPGYLSEPNPDDYWEFDVEESGTEIKVGWTLVDSLAEGGELYFCRGLRSVKEDRCLVPIEMKDGE